MASRIHSTRLCLTALALGMLLATTASAQSTESPIVTQVKAELKHPDRPFILLVQVHVKEGMQKQFESAFATAHKSTRKEKGNVAYKLSRGAKDTTHYVIYEQWKNLAALEHHLQTPYITTLLGELKDLVDGAPEIAILVPVGE